MRLAPLILLFLVACAQHPAMKPIVETTGRIRVTQGGVEGGDTMNLARVEIMTSDGKRLVGNYYEGGEKALLLLHQLNSKKESWDAFARRSQKAGFSLLALDFRGHGESEGDWHSFKDEDFVAMLYDAEAGASFLKEKGKRLVAVLGASIGANTAFRYSSEEHIPAVLLSPGLLYHGIDINNVTSTAPTLIIVGKGDEYSYDSSRELEQNNLLGEHALMVVESAKHGTYLLEEPGVEERIRKFLEEHE